MKTRHFYPLNPQGPLCPLLDDADLLMDFYEQAQLRKSLKKYCKQTRWEAKPPVPYSMGNETLKKLLASLLGNPEARSKLVKKDLSGGESPALHQAIWGWVSVSNPTLSELVGEHSHDVEDRVFMSCSELKSLIHSAKEKELLDEDGIRHVAYLAVAFAMLQPAEALELLQTFCTEFPSYTEQLGLK